MGAAQANSDEQALRAEHDALAARLSARQSVDEVRRAAWALFALAVIGGIAGKLAHDRWGPYHPEAFEGPTIVLWLALAAALACAALAAASTVRARRYARVEDASFARLRELRALLEIDR